MGFSKHLMAASLGLICATAYADAPSTGAPETQSAAVPAATPDDEPDIVITATRNPQPLDETASAVTVITRQQIEQKKPFDLNDVIRLVPSLATAQTGSHGKQTSVFLRGTESNHTLVLIDGARINPPDFGAVDLGTVLVENIERVEVLRGPQSALYGSDAIGGVINIITRRGSGAMRTGGSIEIGDHATNRQVVTAHGQVGKGNLSFAATRLHSSGFVANDAYKNIGGSLRFDRSLSTRSALSFIGRVSDAEFGTPGQRPAFDPNARSFPRDLFGSVQFTNDATRRRDKVVLGYFDKKLRFTDPANPGQAPSTTHNLFTNKVLTLDAQSAFSLRRHTLTAGAELRRERAQIMSGITTAGSTKTHALFLQDEFRTGRFSFVPGVRREDNSQFGHDTNYRLATSYDLDSKSKLKGSLGTGFKAPAISDLYFPFTDFGGGFTFQGNPNLRPEQSTGYEIGYDRVLPGAGRVEVMLFRNRIRDLIASNATGSTVINVDRATTQGLEVSLNQPFGKGFRVIVNQGFLRTTASGAPLLRRPKFTTSADLLYRRGKLGFDLGMIARGRRKDIDIDFTTKDFGGYTRFDLTLDYNLRSNLQVYTRVQNLLNRRYEEVAGFPSPRFNFVIGLQSAAF